MSKKAIENKIESIPETINNIGNSKFIVYDQIKNKNFIFDITTKEYKENPRLMWTLGELFLFCCTGGKGWTDPITHSIHARHGTVRNKVCTIKRIGKWWVKNHPELRLSELTLHNVKQLFIDILDRKICLYNRKPTENQKINKYFTSSTAIDDLKAAINISELGFFNGTLQDGICFNLTDKQVKSWITSFLVKKNINYDDWKKGERIPAVPLPIAMLMLNDAIKIVRDKKTIFLIEYFQFQRSENYYPINGIFSSNNKSFANYCQNKGESKEFYAPTRQKAEILKKLVQKFYGSNQLDFPMLTSEVYQWCSRVHEASLVIMLCLTGARISEITSMKGGSVSKRKDGIYEFKSDIIKTNNGLTTTRAIHGLASEASYVVEQLSYIDKTDSIYNQKIPLFSMFYKQYAVKLRQSILKSEPYDLENSKHGARESRLTFLLKSFYTSFLEKHPEVKSICSYVHPHMFRHTFAEFALRRFEGNVHEAIRRHFRHSNSSFMTNRYLSNKEKEAFVFAEEQMIRENAEKMIIEAQMSINNETFKPQFFGAAMKAAMDLIHTRVVSTEEELSDVIEEFYEEFDRIIPHEYGYCMPRKRTINQSQCFDDISKTAKVENAGFATCSSCLHSVQKINCHKKSIIQIGYTHTLQMASIEKNSSLPIENNRAYQLSKKASQAAMQIIEKMNKSDDTNTI